MSTESTQQDRDAERCKRVFAALGQKLAEEFKGGESILYLASLYTLEVEDVEECIRYMMRRDGV